MTSHDEDRCAGLAPSTDQRERPPEPTPQEPTSWRSRVATVASFPFVVLIRAYQLLISPLTPPTCRFYPSCSSYALTAVSRFGPVKGLWLAARRLLRCHPWNPGGVDHVPQRTPRPHPQTMPEDQTAHGLHR